MFVMLVWHDSQICHARYPRAPFFCHAETQFVMQNRQHLQAQKFFMLSQHLWPPHDTPPSITSSQTQAFLHLIVGPLLQRGIRDNLWHRGSIKCEKQTKHESPLSFVKIDTVCCANMSGSGRLELVMLSLDHAKIFVA